MILEELYRDPACYARVTRVELNGRVFETPLFMPVGTRASVKTVDSGDLEEIGFPIILGNTYHLYLRPGPQRIHELGGISRFMGGIESRILTDSGGFQVFSLKKLRKIDEDGVNFQSVIDGSWHRFTPETVIQTQRLLGSDIMMVFDECPPGDASYEYVKSSLKKTHRWALQCLEEFDKNKQHQHLFGIIQGGVYEELRLSSQQAIQSMPFDGIAIGGLSVGESREDMLRVLQLLAPGYDKKRIRYLMGVGTPQDFVTAIMNGVDIFDCVMPTRVARHGRCYTSFGQINLMNSSFLKDERPLDELCHCKVCKRYSRAYIAHLFRVKEFTGARLATLHNLAWFHQFMQKAREAIQKGVFLEFAAPWLHSSVKNQPA